MTSGRICVQGRVLLFSYWLTYNILKSRKPKFQELQPAGSSPPTNLSAEAPAFVPSGAVLRGFWCIGWFVGL